MFRTYALRGAKAGLVAGLVFALFVALVGNPLIAAAEGGEGGPDGDAHDHAAGASHDHGGTDGHVHAAADGHDHSGSVVSAAVTEAVGVASGVLWGLLLGLAFGVAYFFLEPAIPGSGITERLSLAAAGFVTVSGAPWLLLPPQAPGVEATLPTETRLVLYAGAMVAGALASGLALVAWKRLRPRGSIPAAFAAAAPLGGLVLVASLAPVAGSSAAGTAPLGRAVQGLVAFGQLGLWATLAAVHAHLSGSDGRSTTTDVDALDDDLTAAGL